MFHGTESDLKKFTYHESARIIRAVVDRICEFTYTGNPPTQDECETLCDLLIELQLYSDGRPVVSRTWLPVHPPDDPIPAEAYRGDVGEEIPPGGIIYVWRPGDSDCPVLTGHEVDEVRQNGADGVVWKAPAELRASGLIDWVRGDDGHIVKRPGASGRPLAVSAITPAGKAECARLEGMGSDSPEDRGGWPTSDRAAITKTRPSEDL